MDIQEKKYNMLLSNFSDSNVGREKEMERILRVLVREMKNNIIVIGNSGIGKKTLVQSLIARIALSKNAVTDNAIMLEAEDILYNYLLNKQDFILSLRNQIETCKNTVFFFPDIEAILQEDKDEVKRFYPIFSLFAKRSDLKLIATIDPASYRLFIEKDLVFHKLCEPVRVDEASEKNTEIIIAEMAKNRAVKLNEKDCSTIVRLAKRYIFSGFLPAKAVDIFDESVALAKIEKRKTITEDDIKEVVGAKSGVPVSNISASDQEKLLHLEEYLSQRLIGQNKAVEAVADVLRRSRVGLKDPKKPIGSFLFIGGSGVGKTELAKDVAEFMYDSQNALVRLDMSEYTESHSVQRLIGAPPGYIGYEEGGQLTNPVWERPYSLLLLDEIEKAHPKVFDVFLQVLDEGRLTDGQGKTVDFNNTIIVATSNAGFTDIVGDILKKKDLWSPLYIEQTLMPILMKYFRIEFLNRFDSIIVFKPLDFEDLVKITRLQIQNLQKLLLEKEIILEVSDALVMHIAKEGKNPLLGARAIKRAISQKIENILTKKILSGEIQAGMTISW